MFSTFVAQAWEKTRIVYVNIVPRLQHRVFQQLLRFMFGSVDRKEKCIELKFGKSLSYTSGNKFWETCINFQK